MNKLLLATPLLGTALFAGCNNATKSNEAPNVIYILMDDLGYGELGSYGQELIETPNIDKLAQNGIRFTQSYSGAPVSAPARCVLLTGKHTGHSIVRGNDEFGSRGSVWSHEAMLADSTLEGQFAMPATTRTLGHLMQDANYETGIIGKWGLGYPGSVSTPNKMGFDFFYGYNCQRQAHTYYPMFLYRNEAREYLDNAPLLTPNDRFDKDADVNDPESYKKFERNDYSNDLMFDEVISFVDSNKDKPFFLMWTTPIPHVSLQAPEEWVNYYNEKFKETEPYLGQNGYLPSIYPKATYAAMVSYFDQQVGLLIDKLIAENIYENTIIVFTSDNGPTFTGGSQSPWFNSGGIFKSEAGWGKASVHEGGIRVPLIVSWPEVIKEARVSDHICAFWDVLPTLADIVGSEVPEDVDGISFLPELLGKEQPQHEALYWEYPEGQGSRAVRMGNWKGIIQNIKKGNDKMELYNLDTDIQEQNDIADEHPEIVEQIKEIMNREHTISENANFRFFD
ncbi:MAG: arylsulfatase [Rikenellaceae bacterium]